MAPLKVVLVAGARPNFVKIAPILKVMKNQPERFLPVLVHTGQHYDGAMSEAVFKDLALDAPDYHLDVGSGSHAQQTAQVMLAFEKVLEMERPAWVVVVGDVNSTAAAALTAVKMGHPAVHVEAGLRSFDRTMPEEVNRVLTDAICDLLFTPSEDADENLLREGIPEARIVRVGNVMIDSLVEHLSEARLLRAWEKEGVAEWRYVVVTLHRPSNVDDTEFLEKIVDALEEVARKIPVLFPVHPRTALKLKSIGCEPGVRNGIRFRAPMGYRSFLSVLSGARLALTDSGGVQEEASFLGVPCLTFRSATERPITILKGTNSVIGTDPGRVVPSILEQLDRPPPRPSAIPMWDGKAAERIATALISRSRDPISRENFGGQDSGYRK